MMPDFVMTGKLAQQLEHCGFQRQIIPAAQHVLFNHPSGHYFALPADDEAELPVVSALGIWRRLIDWALIDSSVKFDEFAEWVAAESSAAAPIPD